MGHTPQESIGGVLVSLSRPWARRWINHLSLWRMASATPDLRLPSQPQAITALWLVPNYTAWWQRHMRVNNLPKVVTWKWNGRQLNPRPVVSRANTLTIIPAGHTVLHTRVHFLLNIPYLRGLSLLTEEPVDLPLDSSVGMGCQL